MTGREIKEARRRIDNNILRLNEYLSPKEVLWLLQQAERYEKMRRLNVHQFKLLWEDNINGRKPFDELVDELEGS